MPDSDWLTEEETGAWMAYIRMSVLLSDYLDRQLQHDAGMSHVTYVLLSRLSAEPDRSLRLSALAESLRITRSRLSHSLAKLEQAGWVERTGDLTDKRGQLAKLTKSGFDALSAAAPGHVEAVRRAVFDNLSSPQVRQWKQISGIIFESLTKEHDDGPIFPDDLPWRRR